MPTKPTNPVAAAIRAALANGLDREAAINAGAAACFSLPTWPKNMKAEATKVYRRLVSRHGQHARCEHDNRRTICEQCWKVGTGGTSLCKQHGKQKRFGQRCYLCPSEPK